MGVISQNGIDYPVPSVPVQSDGSATDLTNAAVPTGQTIKSYLNSNLGYKYQWGRQAATLIANGQTEIEVALPHNYTGGDAYAITANVEFYGNPSTISAVLVRNKTSNKFWLRIANSASNAISVYINWITIGQNP